VQSASVKLDDEKEEAEKSFKDLLHKLSRKHGPHRCHRFRRLVDWIKSLFGVHLRRGHGHGHGHGHYDGGLDFWMDVAFGAAEVGAANLREPRLQAHLPHHGPPECLIRKFIKAAKRVRRANKKLIAFERGFISEGGIRNREWYKHLGVAPGLWLG
jgi:N-acetylated-alpha-linked acidic dipeptidase